MRPIVTVLTADLETPLRVIEATCASASAGWPRRQAMEAAAWLDEHDAADAVLLTSDADTRVGPDWVALNLAAIAAGASAVAGRIALDPDEARLRPAGLHPRGRREAEYEALLTEIGARLWPEPGNPWPCHWSKSGATLAVRADVYRASGGMPDLPCGEDRAFVDAVRAAGFVVRHVPRSRSSPRAVSMAAPRAASPTRSARASSISTRSATIASKACRASCCAWPCRTCPCPGARCVRTNCRARSRSPGSSALSRAGVTIAATQHVEPVGRR